MTKALITGAGGFIGRHVARLLSKQGYVVVGIGHGTWTSAEWNHWGLSQWYSSDVEFDALRRASEGAGIVIHCAGGGPVGRSFVQAEEDFRRTVGSVQAVLELIRLERPDLPVVLASSASVYGAAQTLPIQVHAPLKPVSPYGLHKRMAEDLCRSCGEAFGLRSSLVRLFSVYGIGLRRQLLWDACRKLSVGDCCFDGTGDETRDWLHVDDAATLLVKAVDMVSPVGTTINGGTGQAVTVRAIVTEIAKVLHAPMPEFSGSVRPGDPAHCLADIDGALSMGWKPRKHWRQEVRAYAEWFARGAP